MPHPAIEIAASVFGISPEKITDDVGFRSIPQWDSLRHVELMVALEQELSTTIDGDQVLRLDSAAALREFYDSVAPLDPTVDVPDDISSLMPPPAPDPETAEQEAERIERGLAGVVMDTTMISEIDGEHGRLAYRGFPLEDLAGHCSYEQVAHLLLHGDLPDREQLEAFRARLASARELPDQVVQNIQHHCDSGTEAVLRTAVSALGVIAEMGGDPAAHIEPAERLIARIPTIFATQDAARAGRPRPVPDPRLSHAANILHMLELPADAERERLIDLALVVQAEHGCNASAFAARVVAGTGADIHAAVTVALATFAGPLHGGAARAVMQMVDEVGHPGNAADYVSRRRSFGQPVMGFGHRVYRTEDPRAKPLREAALRLRDHLGEAAILDVLEAVREAMRPLRRHGMDVNVDFYSAALYHLLGVPADLFVPMFAASRSAGWLAHIAEQREANILIRPRLRYVGPYRRLYPEV
jgi:citrate synthase